MIGNLGIVHDRERVTLRPIEWLSRDLRDHHLLARWSRLLRRWRKR